MIGLMTSTTGVDFITRPHQDRNIILYWSTSVAGGKIEFQKNCVTIIRKAVACFLLTLRVEAEY